MSNLEIPPTVVPRKTERAGQNFFVGGLALIGLGIVFAFIATQSVSAYGVAGSPAGGILLSILGVFLLIAGFGRRLLAALEKR